jgi:PAS domain S-box-containing protein
MVFVSLLTELCVRILACKASHQNGEHRISEMTATKMTQVETHPLDKADSVSKSHINPQELLLAQVSQAFSLSWAAAVGGVICGLIIVVALWNSVSHSYMLVWFVSFSALYASRQVLAWAFHKVSPCAAETGPWAKWYFVGAVAIGLGWGMSGVLLFPSDTALHKSVLAIFIAGATCVATVQHMPTNAYFPVILAMLLPPSARFFYEGDEVHITVGVLIVMYATVLVLIGRIMHAINTESLTLRFENTDLVHSLREQKAELKAQIDERIRLEEAILISEEKYRQLAENVDDIFMLIRSAEPYSFIYVSPAYERMLGRNANELYEDATVWLTDIHEKDRSEVAEKLNLFVQGTGDFNHEFKMVGPNGLIRWIWATGFPVKDAEGGVYRVAVIARDITQRKLDQEKLESLVREIKNFAYIVSHDFRAPLINIKGFTDELGEVIKSVTPAIQLGLAQMNESEKDRALIALETDLPEALEFINSSASKMDNLINAVLCLSKLERRQLHFESLDMQRLVQEILSELRYQLNLANVKVVVGQLPETFADRLAMEQIVTNLLANAIKFRDPERPQEITITGHRFPGETAFVISDRGRGIDQMYLSKIFQAFHRGSVKDVQGEGMGLAHVRTLVRRHGGRIWCESTPGEGSRFTFTVSNKQPENCHSHN